MLKVLRPISRGLNFLIPGLIALSLWSYSKKGSYPEQTQIREELERDPVQTEAEKRNYLMSYRESEYGIQPMANYEIRGLVVSKNNINAFDDIYHTSDSVDVQDLCLVWGDNLDLSKLERVKFWSEPFSCHVEIKDREVYEWFTPTQLSNTHLLSEDEALRRRIRAIEVGDQIRLTGRLINYHPAGASEQLRRSSLRRDDEGNGACEVMMVEEAEVLHAPNKTWRLVYRVAVDTLAALLLVKLLLFLFLPYLEFRARHPEGEG